MKLNPVTNQQERQLNFIVSSHTHHLMVYEEFNLVWAAKLTSLTCTTCAIPNLV